MSELIIITLIIMLGILCSVIAWQVFSIGKTAVEKDADRSEFSQKLETLQSECKQLREEITALSEKLKNSGAGSSS